MTRAGGEIRRPSSFGTDPSVFDSKRNCNRPFPSATSHCNMDLAQGARGRRTCVRISKGFPVNRTMMSATSALLLALAPTLAQAGDAAVMTKPIQGATLEEGDMSVALYYVERDEALDVVATYVTTAAPSAPNRIQIGLRDKAVVRVSLAEAPNDVFVFRRDGGTVTVSAGPRERQVTELAR